MTLWRYAPALTNEQQVARFFNKPLETTLEAMKPSLLQDALERAKPLSKGTAHSSNKRSFDPRNQGPNPKRQQTYSAPAPYRPRVYAADSSSQPGECHECGEIGHFWRVCPRLNRNRGSQAQRGRGRVNGARGG